MCSFEKRTEATGICFRKNHFGCCVEVDWGWRKNTSKEMGWKATAISLREMTATCTWILAAGGGEGPGEALPCGSDGKESACNAGDLGSISGLERSPGEWNG